LGGRHLRTTIISLLPGVVLPGLVYVLAAPHTTTLQAVVLAGCVPAVDALVRLLRGRGVNPASIVFALSAGASALLALWSGSPLFVLMKGAVVSVALGAAFAVSAAVGRPLIRLVAIALSVSGREARHRLAERWGHPSATDVFRVLSIGWGLLLLVQGGQQAVLAVTASPGLVIAVTRPIQLVATVAGIALSVAYVRRRQRRQPELAVLTEAVA
jgi:intracellular septation protein A